MNFKPVPDERSLTSSERLLLERLISVGCMDSRCLLEQLQKTRVAFSCSCGCPTIGLSVEGRSIPLTRPSKAIAMGGGISLEGKQFGVVLRVRDNQLSELEAHTVGSEGHFTLPNIDQIGVSRLEDEGDAQKMKQQLDRRNWLMWFSFFLLIFPIAVGTAWFALERMHSGQPAGGYNIWWQYVDPPTLFVLSLAYLCFVLVKTFQFFRSGQDKRKR